jgi:hypothetical protein
VRFPATLESIGAFSFAFCSAIESITFPAGLKLISHDAFFGCISLKSVLIPCSTQNCSFGQCRALVTVGLPKNGDVEIGTFDCCDSLLDQTKAILRDMHHLFTTPTGEKSHISWREG